MTLWAKIQQKKEQEKKQKNQSINGTIRSFYFNLFTINSKKKMIEIMRNVNIKVQINWGSSIIFFSISNSYVLIPASGSLWLVSYFQQIFRWIASSCRSLECVFITDIHVGPRVHEMSSIRISVGAHLLQHSWTLFSPKYFACRFCESNIINITFHCSVINLWWLLTIALSHYPCFRSIRTIELKS